MGRAFLFADRLRVNIHGGAHVGVPQQFLLDFQIHAKLPQHGAVGVFERYATPESRQSLAVVASGLMWFSSTAVDLRGSSPAFIGLANTQSVSRPNCDARFHVNRISARTGSNGRPDCEYFVFTSPTTPSTIARRTRSVSFSQSMSSYFSANNSLHLKPVLRAITTVVWYGSKGGRQSATGFRLHQGSSARSADD
jgi:hypothetical protein